MSLILCLHCGHPWIDHDPEGGCEELIETDGRDGMDVCDCRHEGTCSGCVLDPFEADIAPPAPRPASEEADHDR